MKIAICKSCGKRQGDFMSVARLDNTLLELLMPGALIVPDEEGEMYDCYLPTCEDCGGEVEVRDVK